eukprot:TRINITY_DN25306_c0_g1_i1.p2 TRINITY_DN25306_c0_g1~~TRINITY_DN25306_c0_g1_i1.p2  ORF type:complete len:260 (+),score=135.64 TRINITY_DN25306_c0_g1_i1:59-781(+)
MALNTVAAAAGAKKKKKVKKASAAAVEAAAVVAKEGKAPPQAAAPGGAGKKKGKKAATQPAQTAAEDKAASKDVLGDIFSGLKGKKKADPAKKAAQDAPPPEAKAGAPYVTGPHKGYIPAGGNLLQKSMSVAEAKQWALNNKACLGFTYEGKLAKDGKAVMHMKNKYPQQGLMEPNSGWTSFRVVNRDNVSDTFMDLRGEGSSAKVRTTKDGFAIVAADELQMDNGGNTPQCPFDCQCCW